MKTNTDIYCLKVENKHNGDIDFYFKNDLCQIVRLKSMLEIQFPKRLFSIRKVRSIPLLDLMFLDEKDIRALEL